MNDDDDVMLLLFWIMMDVYKRYDNVNIIRS
jgi:hypothetical protein